MKASTLEQELVSLYVYSLEDGAAPPYIKSKPGRGKSTIVGGIASKLNKAFPGKNFGFSLINGGSVTLTTATGYLFPMDEEDGRVSSRFSLPDWYFTREGKSLDAYDGGIVFIDEMDKLDTDSKKIMGEAMLIKRFGTHWLPPGWVVWGAGNRSTDRSGSTKDFDHLINRRGEIELTDDLASLENYLEGRVLGETMHFIRENPEIVFGDLPEKQGPFCTPRSTEAADKYLQTKMSLAGTNEIPIDNVVQEYVAGIMGGAASEQFFAAIRLGKELPTFEEIVEAPETVKVPTAMDAQMILTYKLAAKVDKDTIAPAVTFMRRLSRDFAANFLRSVGKKKETVGLIVSPAVKKWCGDNASLVALMATLK